MGLPLNIIGLPLNIIGLHLKNFVKINLSSSDNLTLFCSTAKEILNFYNSTYSWRIPLVLNLEGAGVQLLNATAPVNCWA